jgi:aminopeptidase YwaD
VLAGDIGERLAGTDQERQAAEYVAETFRQSGAQVSVEEFPMCARVVESERLEIEIAGRWESVPSSLFSNTPGTDGQAVEGPLAFFEAPAESSRTDLSHLEGKAVVHLGCHIESREAYRRLVEARPAFILMVDIRYPGTVPLADGMFPTYTTDVGAVPVVNVAYMDAWRWKVEGASAARLTVEGGMRESRSQSVIAEFPGEDAGGEILFLGGHHDTQADSPGADDNATGVIGVLECARVLAQGPRKRTIRLISFGCEEQLSVGSAAYVRTHREELAQRGRFIFNLDSYGSPLGWNELVCNAPDALVEQIRACFEPRGIYFRFVEEVHPYADHFPFVAGGIPGVTLLRSNCTAGRFFHHRPDDDLERVSIPIVADLLDGVAAFTSHLATVDRLPFSCSIPEPLQHGVAAFWEDLFGGW